MLSRSLKTKVTEVYPRPNTRPDSVFMIKNITRLRSTQFYNPNAMNEKMARHGQGGFNCTDCKEYARDQDTFDFK